MWFSPQFLPSISWSGERLSLSVVLVSFHPAHLLFISPHAEHRQAACRQGLYSPVLDLFMVTFRLLSDAAFPL